ncbi:unnamed protein product [Pedinophyceae sp. YPF-701]|nr:unnamed protein product [Pedinophyceae sp. YPF-701]
MQVQPPLPSWLGRRKRQKRTPAVANSNGAEHARPNEELGRQHDQPLRAQSPPLPSWLGRRKRQKRARTVANSNAQPNEERAGGKKPRTGGKHSGRTPATPLGAVSPNRSGQRIPDQLHDSRPSLAASGGTGTNTATEELRTASADVDASTSYETGLPPADAAETGLVNADLALDAPIPLGADGGEPGGSRLEAGAADPGIPPARMSLRQWSNNTTIPVELIPGDTGKLTKADIERVKGMPQKDAAVKLEVKLWTLKQRCRDLGIKWRRVLTPEEIAGVQGMPQKDAADELGMTLGALKKRCGRLGIKWRRGAKDLTPEEIAGVSDMLDVDAADELGVSVRTLQRARQPLGIKWQSDPRTSRISSTDFVAFRQGHATSRADTTLDDILHDTMMVLSLEEIAVQRTGARFTVTMRFQSRLYLADVRRWLPEDMRDSLEAARDDDVDDVLAAAEGKHRGMAHTESLQQQKSSIYMDRACAPHVTPEALAEVQTASKYVEATGCEFWGPPTTTTTVDAPGSRDHGRARLDAMHCGPGLLPWLVNAAGPGAKVLRPLKKQGGDACVIPEGYDAGELELLQTKPGFYLTMVCLRDLVADGEGLSTEEVEALEGEQYGACVWDYLGIYQVSFFARHVNRKHYQLNDGLWRLVFPVICECPGVVERLGLQVVKFPTNSLLNGGKTRPSREDVEAFVPVGTKKLQGDVITPKHVNDACDEIKAAAAAAGQRLVDAGESGRVLRALQRESGLASGDNLPDGEIRDLGARKYDECGVIKLWIGLTTLAEFLEDSENARALKDQAGPGRAQQLRKMMLDPLQRLVFGCDETWSLQEVLDALQ